MDGVPTEAARATDAGTWAEFGLAGLVIFALFGLILWLLRSQSMERKDCQKQTREERQAWLTTVESITDKADARAEGLQEVMVELTDAVKDMRRDIHVYEGPARNVKATD